VEGSWEEDCQARFELGTRMLFSFILWAVRAFQSYGKISCLRRTPVPHIFWTEKPIQGERCWVTKAEQVRLNDSWFPWKWLCFPVDDPGSNRILYMKQVIFTLSPLSAVYWECISSYWTEFRDWASPCTFHKFMFLTIVEVSLLPMNGCPWSVRHPGQLLKLPGQWDHWGESQNRDKKKRI
jgi:hypothetical protein